MDTRTDFRPPTLDATRVRQIDFALARVRHAVVKAELENPRPEDVAAAYVGQTSGQAVARCLSDDHGLPGMGDLYGAVGLAFNALWRAVQGKNRPAAEAAAVMVAAAAVRLAAAGRTGDEGRAA